MKLLITGHHGQVGQALIQQAAAHNFQVAAYDRSELDIANRAAVLQTVEREQPAVIINAAAYTAVDKAESEPAAAYAANTEGAENLARAAHADDEDELSFSDLNIHVVQRKRAIPIYL